MMRQRSATQETRNRLLWQTMSHPALPPPRLTSDVYETTDGDTFVVEVAVPGLRPEEITIEASVDTLTIHAQPEQSDAEAARRYIQRDQPDRAMSRVIEFPCEIDTENVRASLEHGILRIEAPKTSIGRRKLIKVGPSGSVVQDAPPAAEGQSEPTSL